MWRKYQLHLHVLYYTVCVYVSLPACSQIWAKVIQGCRGPCLGALLCSEEATSDRACSTRLAAIDVAWTEPEGERIKPLYMLVPCRYWLTTTAAVDSHVPRCRIFNSTKHNSRFLLIPTTSQRREEQWNLERLAAGKRFCAYAGTRFPVPALKPLISPHHSTRCNTQCYDPGLTRLKWINSCSSMHKHCTNLHSAD